MKGLNLVARNFEESGASAAAIALLELGIRELEDEMDVVSASLASLMDFASLCYVQVNDLQSAREMMAKFLIGLRGVKPGQEGRESAWPN